MKDLTRLAAIALAAAVVVRDYAVAGDSQGMRAATYLLAVLVVVALVTARDGAVTFSGLALGGHYVLALRFGHVTLDLAAPVMAGLVLAYLDVADLALALPPDRAVERAFAFAALRRTGLVVGVGALGAAAAYAVAALPFPSSPLVRALGLVGVAVAVIGPLALVRRQ